MSDDLTPESIPKPEAEPEPQGAEAQVAEISEQEAQMALDVLRQEQSLGAGMVAGLVAAVVGASVWAGITIVTEYQIGWMAVGVGFLVGYAVRLAGKGIDKVFGIVGAVMSLIGCVLGNLLTIAYFLAESFEMTMLEILSQMDLATIVGVLKDTLQIMDILFYGLAVYFGYRYAFRPLTMEDLNRALGKSM